jgi:hypothetical protein
MTTELRHGHMQSYLLTAVPLQMMALAAKGGPDAADRVAMAGYAQTLAEHGDDLLFGGTHAAGAAADLARSVALLSYMPGGVTTFGLRFEAEAAGGPIYGRAEE